MQLLTLGALSLIENLINQALNYDQLSKQALKELGQAVIAVNINQPDSQVWIYLTGQGKIRLFSHWDEPVDAQISGQGADFLTILKEQDKQQAMMSAKMDISGNTRLLTGLQKLAAGLDIDWQTALADQIGDLPASVAARAITDGLNLFKDWRSSVDRSWHHYWQYESDALLTNTQYESQASHITELRFDTDRLEARIQRLLSARENGTWA